MMLRNIAFLDRRGLFKCNMKEKSSYIPQHSRLNIEEKKERGNESSQEIKHNATYILHESSPTHNVLIVELYCIQQVVENSNFHL